MSHQDKDSKLLLGLLIGGGVIGIGALTVFLATRKGKEPLQKMGEMIVRVGEILANHGIEEPAPVRLVEKKIHCHEDTIEKVTDLVAAGISLWKKIKN